MKYIKYIKEAFFILIVIYMLVGMKENLTLINQLKYENERNRENLYQTNLVIEEMQKRWEDKLLGKSY
tara:strand:- start:15581 stop:15784 length:204 start_codon:yes stop_codon:yes gene_type:complete